jgi:hypothetical protein
MNSEYEKQLEAAIDRELKSLPELSAPRALASQVLAMLAARSALPWYRQPWQAWPLALRAGSLAVLLAALGGLYFAACIFTESAPVATAAQECNHWLAGLAALWRGLNTLPGVLGSVLNYAGPRFLGACVVAVALAYAACIAAATCYYRLGFARSKNGNV